MSGTISPVSAPGISVTPRPEPLRAQMLHQPPPTPVAAPEPVPSQMQAPTPDPQPVQVSPFEAPPSRARTAGKAALVAVAALGFVAIAAQLGLQGLYGGRFLPGVTVAGQDIGGMTRPQARQLLQAKIDGYRIKFQVGSKQYTLNPAEVGARYDTGATLDQAYLTGRDHGFMPLAIWESRHGSNVAFAFSVDQPAEQAFIEKVVDATGQAPVDAAIVITNGVPAVQPDKNGQSLKADQVEQAIDHLIATASDLSPVLTPEVQQADIKAADVAPALAETRQLLAVPVTITYQGKTYKPTPAQMGEWIAYDKKAGSDPGLSPKPNPDGIRHYLNTIENDIDVAPTVRKVTVENGVSKETQAGKDGTALDQDALVTQISAALMAQKPLTVEAPTKPVAFKTVYNNVITLDYGRYIEINLTNQHLWVWQDHQIIYDSPVTSGATGAGFPTAQGLFAIYAKQTDRHLVGYSYGPAYNYDVFVHYWMPFYLGFGLHDASWRHGVFGGPDYYYNGSHGCVNLPDATAAFLYDWSTVGTPVWVHS